MKRQVFGGKEVIQSTKDKMSKTTSSKESSELSARYQQKTEREHILSNPDTYIGSVEMTIAQDWTVVLEPVVNSVEKMGGGGAGGAAMEIVDAVDDIDDDAETESTVSASAAAIAAAAPKGEWMIALRTVQYVPALLKLFDEVIVNSRDHAVRTRQQIQQGHPNVLPVSCIDVTIDPLSGTITVTNDGSGIDIAQHPETGIYIPEMIFARLRTSTNYNKEEKKIVGGKNGFGIKLVFIWSVGGSVETIDHVRHLKYVQHFGKNLETISPAKITKTSATAKPYTRITFTPDYARLGLPDSRLDEPSRHLLYKRVLDVAAITDKTVKVKLDGKVLPIKTFAQYVDLYLGGNKTSVSRIHEIGNDRWEYVVALSPIHEFAHVSFVNGICTSKGGKHVDYILGQITRKLQELVERKKKVKVAPAAIKEQLILFLRCDIENPAFDSQTKDFLNTPSAKFGSTCTVSDGFVEKVASKLGVLDAACAICEAKEQKAAKKTDGSKTRSIRGIPKLTDANWAGTASQSHLCTLIFCEGDSAKAGIVSGLSQEDRNIFGVYPMKGKPMNVRGETTKRVAENKEFAEIKKILGLETGKVYASTADVARHLRYGKVLFMTDQDLDGSHIKGLCLNLFDCEWPSLLRLPGFLGFMNTPILKATKGGTSLAFYNEGEYRAWKESLSENGGTSWHIKYYKGLGTSTSKEFREYFEQKKVVYFEHNGVSSDAALDLIFNKKKTGERKEWLKLHQKESFLDTSRTAVSLPHFFDQEFRHFSIYDCARSLCHLMDGLKTSQRKILYAAFKKPLTREIKVAQFSGYVSEHSSYHHGEASLNAAIVGMAQNFVGSNNIHLLMPNGQMGTRLRGGQDSASERYIFTELNPLTRALFPQEDDAVLSYLEDDGDPVEPAFYAPILPMVLVNGCKGIGTGYSTEILSYNPIDLVALLRTRLGPSESGVAQNSVIHPYYENFRGCIFPLFEDDGGTEPRRYLIKGCFENMGGDKIRVTELPVGMWTADFKEYLESLLEKPDLASLVESLQADPCPVVLKDYVDMSTDTQVDFVLTFSKGAVEWLVGLSGSDAYPACVLNGLEKVLKLSSVATTSNMHLFDANDVLTKYARVEDIVDSFFGVRLGLYAKRKAHQLAKMTETLKWVGNRHRYIMMILNGQIELRGRRRDELEEFLRSNGFDPKEEGGGAPFNYLLRLPMDSVTEENVSKLEGEYHSLQLEMEDLHRTSPDQIWLSELADFERAYVAFRDQWRRNHSREVVPGAGAKKAAGKPISSKKGIGSKI